MTMLTPDMGDITIIDGAIIEYKTECGIVVAVKLHQPISLSNESIEECHDVIHQHLSSGYKLIQEPVEIIGRVVIKKWRVIYE